jgi:hypothetical protein
MRLASFCSAQVYIVHRKDKVAMRRELIYTVTMTKPALNIFRVRTKKPMGGHELMNPVNELAWFRR